MSRREKMLAYWESPEGQAVREQMRRERAGRETPAHAAAMADPEVRGRVRAGTQAYFDDPERSAEHRAAIRQPRGPQSEETRRRKREAWAHRKARAAAAAEKEGR